MTPLEQVIEAVRLDGRLFSKEMGDKANLELGDLRAELDGLKLTVGSAWEANTQLRAALVVAQKRVEEARKVIDEYVNGHGWNVDKARAWLYWTK